MPSKALKHTVGNNKNLTLFILAFAVIGYLIFRAFAASNPNLPGDLNNDNTVNVTDLSILLSNYGTTNTAADINTDGTVNVLDMSILLSHYGQSVVTGFTNTVKPSVSGSITVGSTLTANPGTWSPAPSGYGYGWDLCDSAGNNCGLSPTAVNQTTYVIQAGDAGHTIRVNVGPKDSSGTTQWTYAELSDPTAAITTGSTPPPGTILDDTRAIKMTDIYSNGTPDPNNIYGQELNIDQRQSPSGFWDGMLFSNNDVTLQSDPTFTKVYHMHVGPGVGISRNPWWDSPITHNADLNRMRPLQMGMYDWYGMAVKWNTPMTLGRWACNMQFGYPVITSPSFCLGASSGYGGGDGMYLGRNTGLVSYNSSTSSWQAAERESTMILPFANYSNKWVRFVIGIKWGANKDGEVHVLVRADGEASYHEVYTRTAVNTWQWGGDSSVPQYPGAGFRDNNKLDLYEGWDGALTDINMPNNNIDQTGYVRSNDKATAMSYFP